MPVVNEPWEITKNVILSKLLSQWGIMGQRIHSGERKATNTERGTYKAQFKEEIYDKYIIT